MSEKTDQLTENLKSFEEYLKKTPLPQQIIDLLKELAQYLESWGKTNILLLKQVETLILNIPKDEELHKKIKEIMRVKDIAKSLDNSEFTAKVHESEQLEKPLENLINTLRDIGGEFIDWSQNLNSKHGQFRSLSYLS